jgi:hypothetical protein
MPKIPLPGNSLTNADDQKERILSILLKPTPLSLMKYFFSQSIKTPASILAGGSYQKRRSIINWFLGGKLSIANWFLWQ